MHPLRRASKLWKFHVLRSEDRLLQDLLPGVLLRSWDFVH